MPTFKQSLALEYHLLDENCYKKLDIELAIPEGFGYHYNMPSFLKVEAFLAKSHEIIKNKLKFGYSVTGGIIRPMMGSKATVINDRFFVYNSMGYTHLGHFEVPNAPVAAAEL